MFGNSDSFSYIKKSFFNFKNSFSYMKHSFSNTVDGFIVVGTNFYGLNKNHTFVGFKTRGHSIFLHSSYRKLQFRGHLNSWIGPSTKTTKNGYPRKIKPSTV